MYATGFFAAVLFLAVPSVAIADFEAGARAYRSSNLSQAIKELKEPAEKGEDDAQYLLGAAYANAKPPLQDLAEAENPS